MNTEELFAYFPNFKPTGDAQTHFLQWPSYEMAHQAHPKIKIILRPRFVLENLSLLLNVPPIYIRTLKPGVSLKIRSQDTIEDALQALGFREDLQLNDATLDHSLYIEARPESSVPFWQELLRQRPVKQMLHQRLGADIPVLNWEHQHFRAPLPDARYHMSPTYAAALVDFFTAIVTTFDDLPLPHHPLASPKRAPSWFKKQYPELQPIDVEDKSFGPPSGAPVAIRFSDLGE